MHFICSRYLHDFELFKYFYYFSLIFCRLQNTFTFMCFIFFSLPHCIDFITKQKWSKIWILLDQLKHIHNFTQAFCFIFKKICNFLFIPYLLPFLFAWESWLNNNYFLQLNLFFDPRAQHNVHRQSNDPRLSNELIWHDEFTKKN